MIFEEFRHIFEYTFLILTFKLILDADYSNDVMHQTEEVLINDREQ